MPGSPWDVTRPLGSEAKQNFPPLYRQDKTTLRDQLQVEHEVLSAAGGDTGYHKNVSIRQSTPNVRLVGREVSGADIRIVEDAGRLKVQKNTGLEGTPTWSDLVVIVASDGSLRAPNALVIPVGTNKWAT